MDGSGKFISLALTNFYNKKGINIKYIASYMYKANNIAK